MREKQDGERNILCVKKKFTSAMRFHFLRFLSHDSCVHETHIPILYDASRKREDNNLAAYVEEFRCSADFALFISQRSVHNINRS